MEISQNAQQQNPGSKDEILDCFFPNYPVPAFVDSLGTGGAQTPHTPLPGAATAREGPQTPSPCVPSPGAGHGHRELCSALGKQG